MIEIKELSVCYDQQIHAIEQLNLSLENQKCIGIIGENGSGKSTLLSCLLGLVDFQGEVNIDNIDLNKENLTQIRMHLGLVFQNPDHMLFLPTVRDNLVFGLTNQNLSSEEIKKRINEISQVFHLENLLDRHANHLSGGQKRMVALASVVVMQPSILLLDEPTAFLDPKSRRVVMNTLKTLTQQIILTTHDLDMALDICDEIVLLNQGKVVRKGKTQDILSNEELLLEYGLELPYRYQR